MFYITVARSIQFWDSVKIACFAIRHVYCCSHAWTSSCLQPANPLITEAPPSPRERSSLVNSQSETTPQDSAQLHFSCANESFSNRFPAFSCWNFVLSKTINEFILLNLISGSYLWLILLKNQSSYLFILQSQFYPNPQFLLVIIPVFVIILIRIKFPVYSCSLSIGQSFSTLVLSAFSFCTRPFLFGLLWVRATSDDESAHSGQSPAQWSWTCQLPGLLSSSVHRNIHHSDFWCLATQKLVMRYLRKVP